MSNWLSSETEILKRIADDRQTLANTIYFALDAAFQEHAFGHDVYIAINVPRAKLQLRPDNKPGDIDYLIVPFVGDKILLEQTMAIEAKVLRPSVRNPARNANTMGGSQIAGLLRDGFPFVGLLHISLPEPLPLQMHWSIPMVSNKTGPEGELIRTGEHQMLDPFPLFSAERQEGRVLALNLPAEVGYRVIAMTLSKNGDRFSSYTLRETRSGLKNPHISNTLLHSIRQLMSAESHLFKKICWYDEPEANKAH